MSSSGSASYSTLEPVEREGGPEDEDDDANRRPDWLATRQLNLSYQGLGSGYQLPELLKVLTRASANLVVLKLAHNALTGLPHTLSLPSLVVLDLSYNRLVSTWRLPQATALQVLSLMRNSIPASHVAVSSLRRYKQLHVLTLTGNPISGAGDAYASLVAWAAPSVTSLDGRPFASSCAQVLSLLALLLQQYKY